MIALIIAIAGCAVFTVAILTLVGWLWFDLYAPSRDSGAVVIPDGFEVVDCPGPGVVLAALPSRDEPFNDPANFGVNDCDGRFHAGRDK